MAGVDGQPIGAHGSIGVAAEQNAQIERGSRRDALVAEFNCAPIGAHCRLLIADRVLENPEHGCV